jgi:hypothetical protein
MKLNITTILLFCGFNGCCTAMWKANGKTTTLQLFLDSLSPKNVRDASSGVKLKIALFGELSLEEDMDLSRDRQILDLIIVLYIFLISIKPVFISLIKLMIFD